MIYVNKLYTWQKGYMYQYMEVRAYRAPSLAEKWVERIAERRLASQGGAVGKPKGGREGSLGLGLGWLLVGVVYR